MPNPQLAQMLCAPPILQQSWLMADFSAQPPPGPQMPLALLLSEVRAPPILASG